MLKGISPIVSPELLKTLAEMGHGDEIVFADAHFPASSVNPHVIRADGIRIADLLRAVLPLFELDAYVPHPLSMMAAVEGDILDPAVEQSYMKAVAVTNPSIQTVERVERFAFYERARKAFAVVITGETVQYGNIILKKGVTPPYHAD